MRRAVAGAALAASALAVAAALPAAEPPRVQLPPDSDHRVWVPDRLWQRSALFDGDTGRMLGAIDGPSVTVTPKLPLHARERGEIYSVDVAYSRGRRGERVDYVTIYDARTLSVTGEIVLPTHTSDSNTAIGYSALLDSERYLAAFNQFPYASVSIVDLEQRRFAGQVAITGCAGIYPVDERRFATLCGDGTAGVVALDRTGTGHVTAHSERFFDPIEDPVTMAGVRAGEQRWLFVSFEGYAHLVDFASDPPVVQPRWSLFTAEERAERWRVGGLQHLALHAGLQRLYSLVHQGERGSHKAPGNQVWVYDLAAKQRVDQFELPHFMVSFIAPRIGVAPGGTLHRALAWIPTEGAHTIAVTQDARPLLFARNAEVGVVAVLDGRSGAHLRNLDEAGIAGPTLGVD